jgi:hypothetical protein
MEKIATVAATAAVNKIADIAMSKSKSTRKTEKRETKKEAKKEIKAMQKQQTKKKVVPNQTKPLPKNVPVRFVHQVRPNKVQGEFTKFRGRDALRMKGTDFWGAISTTANANVPIFNMPLNPLAVLNTRVCVEASLWTKYHYNSITIEYIQNVGTAQNGTLLLTHVTDPEMRIPGSPGTLMYTTALMSSKGAVITPYYQEAKHTVRPEDNKKEFYIQPDIADENRLTVQAVVRAVQMTTDNPGTVGFLYVHYDIMLYDKIMSINPSSYLNTTTLVASPTAPTTNSTLKITDGGWNGVITLSIAAADTRFTVSTVYAVYFNFAMGDLEPMSIYYWKTPGAFAGSGDVYTNAYDAGAGSTEGRVRGAIWGNILPTNAVMYYFLASAEIDPTRGTKATIESLEDRLETLETALKLRSLDLMETNTNSPRLAKRVY